MNFKLMGPLVLNSVVTEEMSVLLPNGSYIWGSTKRYLGDSF